VLQELFENVGKVEPSLKVVYGYLRLNQSSFVDVELTKFLCFARFIGFGIKSDKLNLLYVQDNKLVYFIYFNNIYIKLD
jgi:hypothetical protein